MVVAVLRPAIILLVTGAACASVKPAVPDPMAPLTSDFIGPALSKKSRIANTYTPIITAIPLGPDSAYQILKRVYINLQIPVSQESDTDRLIGNSALSVRRKLGGMNMEDVLDCGEKIGTPSAESYDVRLTILSVATSDGGTGSRVATRIQAMGHDPSVSDRSWVTCATKSALEEKIGAMVLNVATSK